MQLLELEVASRQRFVLPGDPRLPGLTARDRQRRLRAARRVLSLRTQAQAHGLGGPGPHAYAAAGGYHDAHVMQWSHL